MKHLDSTETRTKTVPSSRKWMSTLLSILGCFAFLTILFFIPILVYPSELLPELINKFSASDSWTFLSIALSVLIVTFYIWNYDSTARRKAEEEAQRIYLGIIAEKKIKKSRKKVRYYLLLKDKKFKVKEGEFYSFKVGEPAEFRISSNEKGLYEVSKSTIFIPKAQLSKERAEGAGRPGSLEKAGSVERVELEELDLVSLEA
jgi:hypothetical protein